MNSYESTRVVQFGAVTVAWLTGDPAPVQGEDINVNGKEWRCTSVEKRTGCWMVRMIPTETEIKEQIENATGWMVTAAAKSAQSRQLVDRWLATQKDEFCPKHPNVMVQPDRDAMTRHVFDGNLPVMKCQPCPACGGDAKEQAVQSFLRRAGVPKNLLPATLSGFIPRNADEEVIITTVREFARQRRGFIVLIGANKGTGKSHCGVGIMRHHKTARMLTQQELLNSLRKTYRDDAAEDIVAACKRVGCLVLDEMGLSTGGRDEFPVIHDILSHRYNQELTTVLIGNFASKEELLDLVGDRMRDRLTECGYAVLNYSGESHRREQRQKYFL